MYRQGKEVNAMIDNRRIKILSLLLGVWLLVSPQVLRFTDVAGATWTAVIVGVATLVIAAIALYAPRAWEDVVALLLGAWLAVSPWAIGFDTHRAAIPNALVAGVVLVVLWGWALLKDRHFVSSQQHQTQSASH
jgi:hypothetical protein